MPLFGEPTMAIHSRNGLNQTLSGSFIPERFLHYCEYVLVGAAHELLVCSNSDLRILQGGAVQLQ